MSIKISCIIPLYNSEKYIRRCLDSVLKQTLVEFEVIIINDGSNDTSSSIVKTYLSLDKRIKLIMQKNQGVSVSRNIGIKESRGEYIFFLDADDDVTKDSFKSSYEEAKKYSSDILIFNYSKVYSNKYLIKKKKLKNNIIYSTVKEKKKVLSSGVAPWGKIYRKNYLLQNNILFYPGIYYEDIPFFWKSVVLAKRISFLNICIYNYYQNNNSIMNSEFTTKKIKDIIKSMLLIRSYLLEYNLYNYYKDIYEMKVIKTFIKFFGDIPIHRKTTFKIMSKSLNFINLKDYKKSLNFFKYLRYNLFLRGKYFLYRLFFSWF